MLLLTPRGTGGVAVVEARPDEEVRLAACLFTPGGRRMDLPEAGRPPRLGVLRWEGEEVDQVLVVRHPRDGSLELHVHGSEAVLAALEKVLGPLERRSAGSAGELLRTALSEAQLALALEQAALPLSAFLRELEAMNPDRRREAVAAAMRRSVVAMALARPHRLVLCGRQNAGKSTLMNRLLFRERVVTGEQPGLTRDPVRERTCLLGYPYELVDTAGEGPSRQGPDRLALERGRRERRHADRLLVVDGSRGPAEEDRGLLGERTVVLRTKADLPLAPWPADFPCDGTVACLDPASAGAVRAMVGGLLRDRRGLPEAGPVGGPAALDVAQFEALTASDGIRG